MNSENTNWGQSVTGVVIKNGKVLLARHTYASTDNNENSEVLWLDIEEALSRDDVPELTKKFIASAVSEKIGLCYKKYEGNKKHAPYSLYCE